MSSGKEERKARKARTSVRVGSRALVRVFDLSEIEILLRKGGRDPRREWSKSG